MTAFDISLEARIHLLEYCPEEDFQYKEIQSVLQNNGKIDFSLFIDIKQSEYISNKVVEVSLFHMLNDSSDRASIIEEDGEQIFRKMTLGRIELYKSGDCKVVAEEPLVRLRGDMWKFKQIVKWNFKGVPTDGPGLYAVAVTPTEEDDNPDTPIVFDCSYFNVAEALK